MSDPQDKLKNELWRQDSYGKVLDHTGGGTVVVTGFSLSAGYSQDDDSEARTQRMVACWNACRGIPTDALQKGLLSVALSWLHTGWKKDGADLHQDEEVGALLVALERNS